MTKLKPSLKLISIIFVLTLISIILLKIYYHNKLLNRNYLNLVEINYKTSFDNYYITFKKNLINFYESQTGYILNHTSNKNELITSKNYLLDVEVVYLHKKKILDIYSEKIKEGKAFLDIENNKSDVLYKVIVPFKSENKIYDSYINYVIDSRLFLESIKEFDGSNGLIYVENTGFENNIYLEKYASSDLFSSIIEKCETETRPIFELQSKFYVKKTMSLTNAFDKNVANAVFFLDVTKEKESYKAWQNESMNTSIVLFIVAAIIVYFFFSYLIRKIERKENQLKNINKNLENLVEKETKKRLKIEHNAQKEKQKNEQLLIQQSKLALMGEMIGNIAHQWRQPLMQLGAILMYLDAYNEKGKLSSDKLMIKIKDGNSIIDFMSKTIEDFRNYYKPEKQKEEFLVKDSIDSALFIVNSALKNANIKVNTFYSEENISLVSYKNEFSQALLNIITNAKDILILRKIENSFINIDVSKKDKKVVIKISDNAQGIDKELISKVFDPYFTTKHKSQGTGIGLYMTKMIIENNMNGNIKVENKKEGACFTISLNV